MTLEDDAVSTLLEHRLSRRKMLRALGSGSMLAMVGMGLASCGGHVFNQPGSTTTTTGGTTTGGSGGAVTELDVLNFALNLEYLEAEFYSYATKGTGIPANLTGGTGTAGETTGGKQVALSGLVAQVAQEIAADELAHVAFLRSALGGGAVAKPALNLNALGVGFGSQAEFLALARAFEDVGVSAYSGAATLITTPAFLLAASQILGTEAYHAGNIRFQVVSLGATSPSVDGKDQPPTSDNFFPTDSNGLAVTRTATEVGNIVRGSNPAGGAFFPSGLNGRIR